MLEKYLYANTRTKAHAYFLSGEKGGITTRNSSAGERGAQKEVGL